MPVILEQFLDGFPSVSREQADFSNWPAEALESTPQEPYTLMRVLIDEQLNWRIARVFSDVHEVCSVRDMGWTGMRNGDLLEAAEQEFDVLVTMDRNMESPTAFTKYNLAVISIKEQSLGGYREVCACD